MPGRGCRTARPRPRARGSAGPVPETERASRHAHQSGHTLADHRERPGLFFLPRRAPGGRGSGKVRRARGSSWASPARKYRKSAVKTQLARVSSGQASEPTTTLRPGARLLRVCRGARPSIQSRLPETAPSPKCLRSGCALLLAPSRHARAPRTRRPALQEACHCHRAQASAAAVSVPAVQRLEGLPRRAGSCRGSGELPPREWPGGCERASRSGEATALALRADARNAVEQGARGSPGAALAMVADGEAVGLSRTRGKRWSAEASGVAGARLPGEKEDLLELFREPNRGISTSISRIASSAAFSCPFPPSMRSRSGISRNFSSPILPRARRRPTTSFKFAAKSSGLAPGSDDEAVIRLSGRRHTGPPWRRPSQRPERVRCRRPRSVGALVPSRAPPSAR